MKALNWGCGPNWRDGGAFGVCSDRLDFGQHHVGNVLDGLPFDDGTFDVLVGNHALQMIPLPQVPEALAELRRVTAIAGVLRLLVPDLMRAVAAYHSGDAAHFLIDDAQDPTIDGKLCRYVTQNGSTRSVFTRPLLARLVDYAGFEVHEATFGRTSSCWPESVRLDSRERESIIVEGIRRR